MMALSSGKLRKYARDKNGRFATTNSGGIPMIPKVTMPGKAAKAADIQVRAKIVESEHARLEAKYPGFAKMMGKNPVRVDVQDTETSITTPGDMGRRRQHTNDSAYGLYVPRSPYGGKARILLSGKLRYANETKEPWIAKHSDTPNWNTDMSFAGVYRHELGHAVQHKHRSNSVDINNPGLQEITQVSKWVSETKAGADWGTLFEEKRHAPSQYAKTNPGELFAECFSAYTHKNYKGGLTPQVEAFMKKLLGA
jgi:hypothetical protein